MNKKLLASGSAFVVLLMVGSGIGFAQVAPTESSTADQENTSKGAWHFNHNFKPNSNSDAGMTMLATKLGLNADQVKRKLQSGKSFKQILADRGITRNRHFGGGLMAPEMLQAQANALGITVDQLKLDLKNKQTPRQIATTQGLTIAQFNQKLAQQLQTMIQNGTITGDKVTFFNRIIKRLNQPKQ
ncbi:MAG: hypothetical protein WC843_06160 [Candidatus Gracilibacteria bacterium]|jgi:hypothetical protein